MSANTLRAAIAAVIFAFAAWTAPASAAPIHQLRIYEVFEGQEAALHARFGDHAARIMKRHDFKILAMWEAKARAKTEFVYLLERPSREVMADRWAGFMADKEWSDIKAKSCEEHGPLMGPDPGHGALFASLAPT